MKLLGYIVQSFNEDEPIPRMGAKPLFPHFADAKDVARDMIQNFIANRDEAIEGPFQFFNPTESDILNTMSSLIFQSRDYFIWIDMVYEPTN